MLRLFTGVAAVMFVCAPAAIAQAGRKQITISPVTIATLSKSKVAAMQEPITAPRRPARTALVSPKLNARANRSSSGGTNTAATRFGPVGVREIMRRPPIR